MKAILLDLDGTACDVRSIKHHVEGSVKNLDRYHLESVNCPPNAHVLKLVDEFRNDHAILVVTARDFKYYQSTVIWLDQHNIAYNDIFMRSRGDVRPDYEVKSDMLTEIIKKGYSPVHAFDDNPAIIRLWSEHGIETTFIEGYGFDSHE